ncbi:phage tail protein [Kitasatospora mediocidica]|uniref:phage tail protein n=1 Tax=Kitasatospora mediocidica TaxID=58352 RepID=UPI00068B92F2|nr:phage tail protein [Kitasatospora mediocidica]
MITLADGALQDQPGLAAWLDPADDSRIGKRDISISLTDDAGTALFLTWSVRNAFPTKLAAPDFDASSNEVAIEEVSLSAGRFSLGWH